LDAGVQEADIVARAGVAFCFQIHQSQLQIFNLLLQLRLLLMQGDIAFTLGRNVSLCFRR
jgi:hypothetical protein